MKNRTFLTIQKHDAIFTASMIWVVCIVLTAIFAPLIANDKPIYLKTGNQYYFPAISGTETISVQNQHNLNVTVDVRDHYQLLSIKAYFIMPPVQFYPNRSDIINSGYKSPSDKHLKKSPEGVITERKGLERHLLGTGKRGDDLLAGLIHGTRISITAGILSMIIAGVIGIFLGSAAGYFGDKSIRIKRASFLTGCFGFIPAWFYAVQLRTSAIENAINTSPVHFWLQILLSVVIFIGVIFLFIKAGRLFGKIRWMNHQINVPVDSMISRCIEIFTSIPSLILIISLAAISKPSLVNLIMIIGLTSWTEIARLTRAEMLRLRKLDFIAAARGMAFTEWYILFRHGLPNAIAPATVAISFGIASAILIESGLTFLGIGVPQDIATWGSLLYSGKENFNAWWLVIFPGIAIFLTVTSFNLIGEHLRERWDPRS